MRRPSLTAVRAFEEKVNQLLVSLRGRVEQIELAILAADRARLEEWSEKLEQSFVDLEAVYPSNNWPTWLRSMRGNARNFLNHREKADASSNLVSFMKKFGPVIEKYTWDISGSDFSLDVDATLEDELSKSSVDNKFDKLISELESLIGSGQIDHQKAYDDLSVILAMLKSAKSGGFSEKIVTWKFARRFLANLVAEYAKAIPGVKQFWIAAEKTAEELDVDLAEVGRNAAARLYDQLQENLHAELLPFDEPVPLLPDLSNEPLASEEPELNTPPRFGDESSSENSTPNEVRGQT